jgi:peptide/nickel transport system permease protein
VTAVVEAPGDPATEAVDPAAAVADGPEAVALALPRRRALRHTGLVLALVFLALILVAVVFPGLLAGGSPTATNLDEPLRSPSWSHWFGTDESGRDLYTRVVHGARDSLLIGGGAAAVAIGLALLLGSLAALGHRWVAGATNRLIEVVFAFPTLLAALLLVAVLGPSAWTQVVAVGVGSSPGYARIVRGQVLAAKDSGYVEAAVELGHPRRRILLRHVMPNAIRPLVAIFALAVGQLIVWASSLSFLGLGVAPPSSEWGALLDAGRPYVTRASWLIVLPGLVIVVLALATTTVGKHLRNRLERGSA